MKKIINKAQEAAIFFVLILTSIFLFSCSGNEDSEQKHIESANAYLAEHKLKEAEIELKNAVQKNPENDSVYVMLSDIYRKLQNPEKELLTLVKAVNINPDNMDAQHRLAQVYILADQNRRARETAEFILTKAPQSTKALHLLATVQVQERNVDAALKTIDKALSIEPGNPNLHSFVGYLYYYGKNDPVKSEAAYLKAISIDDTLSEAYEELIAIYKQEKLYGKLENLLINWTGIPGGLKHKLGLLASLYESQGKFKKAEETHLQLIEKSDKNNPDPIYTLGLFYARTKQLSAAADTFIKTLTIKEDPNVQSDLARIYFDQKDYSNAQKQVDAVLSVDPSHPVAKLLQCRLLIVRKLYAEALENIEQLIGIDKGLVQAHFLRATCLIERDLGELPAQSIRMTASGDLSSEKWKRNQAIESLKTAVDISPDFMVARMLMADLHMKNKELLQAARQLEYILKRVPTHQGALLMLGNLKIQEQEWEIAEKIFLQLIERTPDLSVAHVKLGVIYHSTRETSKAIDSFKKALAVEPLNMDALRHIINGLMGTKQKAPALHALNAHLNHPELTAKGKGYIQFLLGKIALSEGAVDQAKKHFKTSIMTFEKTTPSYDALAYLSEKEGNQSRAVQYYEFILSYDPNYFPAYLALSRIHQAENNVAKARAALEKVLEIQDDFAPAANDLAYILAEEESNLQKALQLARTAELQAPGNPFFLDTLGWVYYKQNSYDLAIKKLSDSIDINPDNPLSHYHLGWAYYDTGRYEKAREQMKRALELNTAFEGADKARALIGIDAQ